MANPTFIGGAQAVAQVDSGTPGGTIAGATFTMLLADKLGRADTIETSGHTTVKQVVDALTVLAAARKSAGVEPWNSVTTTDDDSLNTITADSGGVPFVLTCSADASGTFVRAAVTACGGPGVWDDAENWIDATVPVASDDVKIDSAVTGRIYGGDYTATKYNSLDVQRCTAPIGSATDPIQVSLQGETARTVTWRGVGRAWIQAHYVAAFHVKECGRATTNADYDLVVLGTYGTDFFFEPESGSGRCAVAHKPGDVAEFDNAYANGPGVLWLGDGLVKRSGTSTVALDLVQCDKGAVVHCYATTDEARNGDGQGGELNYYGGACADVKAHKAVTRYNGDANIGTKAVIGAGATLDYSGSTGAITVAACEAGRGAVIRDPFGRVTYSAGILLPYCSANEITLATKIGATIDVS